jgi:Gluconate 2-dehydrogenase subunit 3
MKRRHVLQTLAALPAAVPLLKAQQPMVPPKPSPAAVEEIPVIESTIPDMAGITVPSFFSPAQLETLRRLSELIAPAINGVPGAMEARAPEFIDFYLSESPAERQELYRSGLDELNSRAQSGFHVPFAQVNGEQAAKLLAPLCGQWTAKPDQFTGFLRAAKQDILQATQNSYEWVRVMSKRVRSAGGLGMYWFPIE